MAQHALNHPLTPHLIQFFDTDGSGFIDASELVKVILCALTLLKNSAHHLGMTGLAGGRRSQNWEGSSMIMTYKTTSTVSPLTNAGWPQG